MSKRFTFIILFSIANFAPHISSADESLLTESDFFNDMPMVLSGTRLKQSKNNSPTATTIIDREMIDASGFTEIADLLRLAPGMLVNYDSGHIAAAGYQFLFDRYRVRFQVLVDGNAVNTPLFGEMPWTQLGITIDDIERVEVIRGASSSSYGPNAMTGVISIITRHSALDKGKKFKLNEGVNGRSEQYFRLGDSSGQFDYRLSINTRKDDGFTKRYDSKKLAVANFRGDYQATNKDILSFTLSHNEGDYQEDASDGLNDSMPEHVKYVSRTSFAGKWTHNFSDKDIFALNYYQQKFDENNGYLGNFTSEGYGYVYINGGFTTNRKNLELTYTKYAESYSLVMGSLYRIDNTVAPQYLYQVDKDIHTKQYFINTEIRINKNNIFNAGVLYDDNHTGGKTTSPRISFNHQINKDHTLRISYAEASRSPYAMEEYTNRVIYVPDFSSYVDMWKDKSDLNPERVKTADVGYIASLNNYATEIDMRIYKTNLSQIIIHDWSVGGGFNQGGDFDITGFESSISHNFSNRTKAVLNYARTKITAGNIVYGKASDYETGAPEDSGSLLIMHNFNISLKGSLGYYYTGRYQQLCCETQQQDPRRRLDLVLSKSFKWGGYNTNIKFVLQNATNEKVKTRLYNNYHRQGYISLSMDL